MEHIFDLYKEFNSLVNAAIFLTISLGAFAFLWGIVRLLFNGSNEVIKKEAKSYMVYGLLALFVMTSVWGIVNLLAQNLNDIVK